MEGYKRNNACFKVGQLKFFFGTYSVDLNVNMFIHIFNEYLLRAWHIIMAL